MTVSNRSGAAHDGARSQGKASEGAPEGPTRLPFLRAQGARVTEGSKGPERVEGPEAVRAEPVQDAPVTWPGQAADEPASYQGDEPASYQGDEPASYQGDGPGARGGRTRVDRPALVGLVAA